MSKSQRIIKEFKDKYRFLSNFWLHPIEYERILYPSVEHAFQAQKTLSYPKRVLISMSKTPASAKARGKLLLLRSDWEQVKESIMLDLLRIKFQDTVLKNKLLATGDSLLIEGNRWHDIYWGIDLNSGIGKNRLGKVLMQIRQEILQNKTQE